MNENKHKHLDFIQSVISRMASNSFALKGWTVVFVSGLFALAAKDANVGFVCLAYFPAIAFWVLDGYYLRQEKLFRALYEHVRMLKESDVDFSMDTTKFEAETSSCFDVLISPTLRLFHGAVLVTITAVMLVCWISAKTETLALDVGKKTAATAESISGQK